MFEGIAEGRFAAMSPQERRWLDNVKKAFYESDLAVKNGRAADRALEEMFKAIDTAKTLRRSLRNEPFTVASNKAGFVEFLSLEIPDASRGGLRDIELPHARSGKRRRYSFPEVAYEIRCMIHENENLNAAEGPSYHILLDWTLPGTVAGRYDGKVLTLSGFFVWRRLREVMAKFITGVDASVAMAGPRKRFHISVAPPLGSINAGVDSQELPWQG